MPRDEARLLELLLSDRAFRRRFESDPAFVAREAGFPELAAELSRIDNGDGRRLDARESRSSAAGVFMAAALEGLGLFELGDAVSSGGDSLPTPSSHDASLPDAAVHRQADVMDQTARAAVQAALSPNPDDWEGNLDDEDGGADEADGSNEDEPDEGGGEDDDGGGGGEDEGDDEADEDENEGQDEIGEGSRGEDANDDESDESDAFDESNHSSDSDSDADSNSDTDSDSGSSGSGDMPSDDGAYSLDGAPGEYPGDDAAREDIAAWMGAQAQERGLPAELPVMTSLVESGMRNLDHGDADSVGLFQMRLSVWDHGDYEGYPDDPDLQLKWFLDHAEAVQEQRVERGLAVDDPNQYGDWIADVQRPAEQFRGRYQVRLDDARDLLGRASAKYGGDAADGDASHDGDDGNDSDAQDGTAGIEDAIDGLDASPDALTALAAARSELGTPYLWGGSSPSTGFDCSGLVQWAYAQAGIRIPRVTYDQIEVGQRIDRSHLLPGDLVFFRNSSGDVHHVGMSLGGDKFVQAPHTGDVVKVSSLNESYYAREFTGGRRMDPAVVSDDQSGPSHGAGDGDDRPSPHRGPTGGDPNKVREANRALERDAAQARQRGTRIYKALERQERGKGEPPHPSEPHPPNSGAGADAADSLPPLDPQAEDAAQHIAQYHYGFVRESSSTPDYKLLKDAGYNGILFHAEDAHLGQAMAAARAAGIQSVGIWAPANMEDPATFAHRLADLEQYKPDIVVPDVEIEGKGYLGSPQWQWSEDFVSLYRKLVPNQRWAVTPMGNQDDFNYAAYTSRGASVWPQTYGATYDTKFDPQAMIDVVVRNGVDPRLVNPILAPGQSAEGLRNFASYALDDFQGKFPPFRR
jgi:NlpC/P60 family